VGYTCDLPSDIPLIDPVAHLTYTMDPAALDTYSSWGISGAISAGSAVAAAPSGAAAGALHIAPPVSSASAVAAAARQAMQAAAAQAVGRTLHVASLALHNAAGQASTALHSSSAMVQHTVASVQQQLNMTTLLKQQLAEMAAHNQALEAQLQEAVLQAEFAQARAQGLQQQLERRRAAHAVGEAVQAFRRHTTQVPGDVDPSLFCETQAAVLGKGGCATVRDNDLQ
jgi:hypothetical protein